MMHTAEDFERVFGWDAGTVAAHPPTHECLDPECWVCAVRDCPQQEPLHYDKDGCPACSVAGRAERTPVKTDIIIYDSTFEDLLEESAYDPDEPIPFVPIETPTIREGLHFTPDDEYGYGT